MNNFVNISRTIQTNLDGSYTVITQTTNIDGTVNNNIEHYQTSAEIPYNYFNDSNNINYNYGQPSISIMNNINNILFPNNIWNNLNEPQESKESDYSEESKESDEESKESYEESDEELYGTNNVNLNNQYELVNIGNMIFSNMLNNFNVINENNNENNNVNNESNENNVNNENNNVEILVEEIINTVDDSIIESYNSGLYNEIEIIDIYLKSIYINHNNGIIVTNALPIFIENVYKKLYARYYEYDEITRSLCLYLLITYEIDIEDSINKIKPILTEEIKRIQNRRNILQQFIQLLRNSFGLDNNSQDNVVLTLEQFDKLKTVKLNELDETMCSICSDKYTDTDVIVCLDCSKTHHFHKECIKEWTTKHKASCPLCRKAI